MNEEIQIREWGDEKGGEEKGGEESHLLGFYLVRNTLLDIGFVSKFKIL